MRIAVLIGVVGAFVMTGCTSSTSSIAHDPRPGTTHEGSAAQPCAWPAALDAVAAAPRNHRVLLENEKVRVLDVTVAPVNVSRSMRTAGPAFST